MGLLTPFTLTLSSRLEVGITALIADIIRIIFSYDILFNVTDKIPVLVLLSALPSAIPNPLSVFYRSVLSKRIGGADITVFAQSARF